MKPRHTSNETGSDTPTHRIRDRRHSRTEEEAEPITRASGGSGANTDNAPSESAQEPNRGRSADKPHEIPKKGWKDILWRTKEEMKNDNLSIVAAGVAFYIFLGLIPALGAVISIWGLVADPATIQEQIGSLAGFMPQEVISIIDEQMTRIASEPSGATLGAILGTLLALWSGAKAMKALMTALNITYDEEESRGFIRLNLTALALTLAGVVGFLLAVGIIVALPMALGFIGIDNTAQAIVKIIRWPLLALFAVLGLGIVYRYAPDRDPARWRWVSWGAVAATLLWIALSVGFSFYVSSFGNYNKTYGSLGAIVVFLLWFMLSAYVVLLGAELNAEMEHQTERDTTKGPDQPRGQRKAFVADDLGKAKRN